MDNQRNAPIAVISLVAGILVAGALILSGLGVRWDLWSYRTGLTILRWSAYGGLGVIALSLVACFYVTTGTVRRGLAYATMGGLCGVLAFAIPASMLSKVRSGTHSTAGQGQSRQPALHLARAEPVARGSWQSNVSSDAQHRHLVVRLS